MWGASASAYKHLLEPYGYILIGIVIPLDLFWIRADVIDAVTKANIPPFDSFFTPGEKWELGSLHHERIKSRDDIKLLIDVEWYLKTKDLEASRNRAMNAVLKSSLPCFERIKP
jgi:hypothetical protein